MNAAPASRRSAIGLSFAAIAAGLVTPGLATAASSDAAIIALCNRLVALDDECNAITALTLMIEDEDRVEPDIIAIEDRRDAAVEELERLGPPTTLAGIKAMARASLATHSHKNSDNEIIAEDGGHWLALAVCECLAAGVAA
jgi:hypothetical protein